MDDQPAIQFYHNVYIAMRAGDLAGLEELTHLSSFPSGVDGWLGDYWLTTAVGCGNLEAIAWVLGKGVVPTYVDASGRTALIDVLQLENDHNRNEYAEQPLSKEELAALTIRIIDLLVAAGADVNQRASLDQTALHFAACWSSPKVVGHLLALGADPTVRNSDYDFETPADAAKFAKRWDIHAILDKAMPQ